MYFINMSAVLKFQLKWELGLKVVEDAMLTMPKAVSHHLIKHKLMFKSRLGKNMEGDVIMFSVSYIPVICKSIYISLTYQLLTLLREGLAFWTMATIVVHLILQDVHFFQC